MTVEREGIVRPARPEDAAGIAAVQTRGWQVAYRHVFPEQALAGLAVDASRWRSHIEAPEAGASVVVAEVEGAVAGFASVGRSRDESSEEVGELYAIYVEPGAWGRGLGQRLLGAAEQRLRESGCIEATLWVLEDNPRARRFYEASGWHTDGTTKRDTFLGTDVTEVRYRKRLATLHRK